MKKTLLKISMLAGLALAIFSCSNEADDFALVELAGANATVNNSKVAEYDIDSTSATAVLYSNLNPGYGNAVYFAGTFKGNWAVAYRGTYSENNGWTYSVETDKAFEWKALTGSYDLGSEVRTTFAGLRYLGTTSAGGSHPNPSWYSNAGYGNALYFVGCNTPTVATRGTFVTDHWTTGMTNGSTSYDVYIGSWDLGETYYGTFEGLTWDNGDNNVYEYDGYEPDGDGIVRRRALLLSNIDGKAVCMGTINAMTSAFQEQKIDGKSFDAVEKYTDLTLKEINDTVQDFFKDSDGDDVSYVFINAHGGSDGCICIGTNGNLYGKDVRTLMDKYVRGEVVFIIESCHAGNIIDRSLSEDSFAEAFISSFKAEESDTRFGELASSRFHVLCSSMKSELSWTWSGVIGFASEQWSSGLGWNGRKHEAIALLADLNSDNKVTMEELYFYSREPISYKQTIVAYPDNDNFIVGGRY